MQRISVLFYLLSTVFIFPNTSLAFKSKAASIGFGYYSQNVLNKVAQKDDGSTGVLGEPNYPLTLKYDHSLSMDWFMAPQLSYTILPRNTPGDSAKISITHLVFQFGQNLRGASSSTWDWYIGPGIINYEIKGVGGTTVLNNGTSSATFAQPGRSSTVRKLTSNIGGSINFAQTRIGLDLIIENLASSQKRTESLMLSYAYQFAGGF